MEHIYNNDTYLNNNPSWHEEDAPFKSARIAALLARNKITFKTVCEIGCGSGEILVQLEKKLPADVSFSGFDISAAAIDIAKKKETAKIKFYCNDISTSKGNYFFDLLLVIDVIEHVENYFSFLKGTALIGKYTVFHIPLDISVWSLFREQMLVESKNRVGHIHNFTEDFILNILSDHGFKKIDKIYTEPVFETMPPKQKIINGVRKILFKINKKFCTKLLGGYSVLVLCENNAA